MTDAGQDRLSGARGRDGGWTADVGDAASLAEKRRLLLLVRCGLTLGICYLLIFGSELSQLPRTELAFVLLYLASNLLIALLPARILAKSAFDIGLILTDTAAISFALYLLPQSNTDVFVFYFVVILLASISDRLMLSLLTPLLTSLAYLGFLLARHGTSEIMQPAILLRVPFFLLTGAFYGFFVDRVRRSQVAAAAAQHREEARTEFLSLITHDLKQPLWVAQQSAVLLYERIACGDTQQRMFTAQLIASLRRMEALSLNFLELGRIQTRGVRVLPRNASLNEVIEDLADSYRPIFELRGLHVRLELDPILPPGWIDPPQLERALTNLVDNAVKFTPEGGEILLRTAAVGDRLVITIRDSGPGVPPERAATLFSRFDVGKDVRGRRSTGLGLYISQAIVAAHGGEIALDDTVSQGACFHVRLPNKEEKPAPQPSLQQIAQQARAPVAAGYPAASPTSSW